MAQAPRDLAPLVSAWHFFGAELRKCRVSRGLSQRRLGALALSSGDLICKIEKAERKPTLDLARRLDAALHTGQTFQRLWRAAGKPTGSSHSDSPLDDLGTRWATTVADTVKTIGRLWRADLERRSAIVGSAWVAAGFAMSSTAWLQPENDVDLSRESGRRVGQAEVAALWAMCQAFADADHRLGGGYARSTVVHYVTDVVCPLLEGSYSDEIGRGLMAAAARICDLSGFMAFDSGRQGLAQRQYIQALRLAKASGDRALGVHILADMSMQALYLRAPEALDLAEAGVRTARGCRSYASVARCLALKARAHARRGDAAACGRSMNEAESALAKVRPDEEPAWIRFFDHHQLYAEFVYAADDLGHAAMVRRFAPTALTSTDGMQRRQVLAGATVAATYVGRGETDVERACAILTDVVPAAGALTSLRGAEALNRVRRKLTPYAPHPAVRKIEDDLRTVAGAVV